MTGSKNQLGFTLLEVLVALGIFASLVVVALTIFLSILRLQRSTVQTQQAAQDLRFVMETMSRDLRQASFVGDSAFGENEVFFTTAGVKTRYYVGPANDGAAQDQAQCAARQDGCTLWRGTDSTGDGEVDGYQALTDVPMVGFSTTLLSGDGLRTALTIAIIPAHAQTLQTTIVSRLPSGSLTQ